MSEDAEVATKGIVARARHSLLSRRRLETKSEGPLLEFAFDGHERKIFTATDRIEIDGLPPGNIKDFLTSGREQFPSKIKLIVFGGASRALTLGRGSVEEIDYVISPAGVRSKEHQLWARWLTLHSVLYPGTTDKFENEALGWSDERLEQEIAGLRRIVSNIKNYPVKHKYFLENVDWASSLCSFSIKREDFKSTSEEIVEFVNYKYHWEYSILLEEEVRFIIEMLHKGLRAPSPATWDEPVIWKGTVLDYLGIFDHRGYFIPRTVLTSALETEVGGLGSSIEKIGISQEGEIYDPFNGRRDLMMKRLRFLGGDFKSMNHCKVLRALRLKHQYGLEYADEATQKAVEEFFLKPGEYRESKLLWEWARRLQAGEEVYTVNVDLTEGKGFYPEEDPFGWGPLIRGIFKHAQDPDAAKIDLEEIGVMPILEAVGIDINEVVKKAKELKRGEEELVITPQV